MQVAPTRGATGPGKLRRAEGLTLARTVFVTAFALLALAAYSPSLAASSVIDLAVNPTQGIAKNGQTVSVDGSEVPTEYVTGKGVLLSIVAVVDGEVLFPADRSSGAARYLFSRGSGPTKLTDGGTFATTLELSSSFDPGAADEKLIDCLAIQCEVAAWEGQTAPESEADLFARVPISFGPGIVVDPADGLPVLGRSVAVSGVGFHPDEYPHGLRASLALAGETDLKIKDAIDVAVDPDGEFSGVTVPVAGIFIKAGGFSSKPGDNVDCIVEKCSIVVWDAAEEAPVTADIITSRPVTFVAPKVTVAPVSKLESGQSVSVTGTGFSTVGNGVYLSQVAEIGGEIIYPPPASKDIMRLIKVGRLKPGESIESDGSFASSIIVQKTFRTSDGKEIDCAKVSCSIISWRAHTFPEFGKLYSSTRLSFATPGPDLDKGVEPDAMVEKPAIRVTKKTKLSVGRKAKGIRLAAVVCNSTSCTVKKPKRAVLKVGKRKFALKVGGPAKLAQGKRGVIRLRVPAKVVKKLVGRKGRVKFSVVVQSEAGNKKVTINKVLVGAKKKGANKSKR